MEYKDELNMSFKYRVSCNMNNVLDPSKKLTHIYFIHSKPDKMTKKELYEKKKKNSKKERHHLKRNAQKKPSLF